MHHLVDDCKYIYTWSCNSYNLALCSVCEHDNLQALRQAPTIGTDGEASSACLQALRIDPRQGMAGKAKGANEVKETNDQRIFRLEAEHAHMVRHLRNIMAECNAVDYSQEHAAAGVIGAVKALAWMGLPSDQQPKNLKEGA